MQALRARNSKRTHTPYQHLQAPHTHYQHMLPWPSCAHMKNAHTRTHDEFMHTSNAQSVTADLPLSSGAVDLLLELLLLIEATTD
jgi:hypothetical protein